MPLCGTPRAHPSSRGGDRRASLGEWPAVHARMFQDFAGVDDDAVVVLIEESARLQARSDHLACARGARVTAPDNAISPVRRPPQSSRRLPLDFVAIVRALRIVYLRATLHDHVSA